MSLAASRGTGVVGVRGGGGQQAAVVKLSRSLAAKPCTGVHAEDPTVKNTHLLPVFVFDMGKVAKGVPPTLLDGEHKALAFSDMVIAKRREPIGEATARDHDPRGPYPGRGPLAGARGEGRVSSQCDYYQSHFRCDYHQMEPSVNMITREAGASPTPPPSTPQWVVRGASTCGWGLPDTSTFYTPAGGKGSNYLWSVGNTPFGPLSDKVALTAAQVEAAHRNIGLALLNESLTRVHRVLGGLESISIMGIDNFLSI
eukprot:gene30548-35578_t